MTPEELEIAYRIAKEFHQTYERLAPAFDYKTRTASAVPWEDVPEQNKLLMVEVVGQLLDDGVIYWKRRDMAEPKLQVEQRLDNIERAVGTMAQWLVQAQTGFNANDAAGIEKILRGEKDERVESSSDNPDPERQE